MSYRGLILIIIDTNFVLLKSKAKKTIFLRRIEIDLYAIVVTRKVFQE